MDKAALRARIAELEHQLAARSPAEDIYRTLTDAQLAAQIAALDEALAGFRASLERARAEQQRRRT